MVRCGTYWADTKHPEHERRFGPLLLTLISKVGLPAGVDLMHGDPESVCMSTQDWLGVAESQTPRDDDYADVCAEPCGVPPSRGAHGGAAAVPRGPDMNVPDDPRGVLGLVKEVESAVRETDGCVSPVPKSPNVGVGRKAMRVDPGSGIARHAPGGLEMRRVKEMEEGKTIAKGKEREVAAEVVAMDVDEPPSGPSPVVSPAGQDKMVIVRLPVSANAGPNMDAGGNVDDGEGLVVHVPAVVVPASATMTDVQHSPPLDVTHVKAPRTPVQADRDEASPDSEDVAAWVAAIQDTLGTTASGAQQVPSFTCAERRRRCWFIAAGEVGGTGELQPPQDVIEQGKTDQENTASESVPIPCPRPLSWFSPPLGAAHSLPDTQPPTYVPDPRVSSSFPERPCTTVDHKEPRALHGAPKTSVSLKLKAVCVCACGDIEGALRIVDEERARERQKDGGKVVPGKGEDETMAVAEPVQEKKNEAGSGRRGVSPTSSLRFTYVIPLVVPRVLAFPAAASHPPVPQFERFNNSSSAGMSDSGSTSSTGKRGASPTELLKEGKQGEVLLSKRPSIKRKVQTPIPWIKDQEPPQRSSAFLGPGIRHPGVWCMYTIPRVSHATFLVMCAELRPRRLAFFAVSNNVVILSLRAMVSQFLFFITIAAACFSGLLFTLCTLGQDADPAPTLGSIASLMTQIWFGNTSLSFRYASRFHPTFGPVLMLIFAALSNTLLLTILISLLSNTVARIDANATQEYLFQFAISTMEGVKSDALFSYQPPFNILAFVILKPATFILFPRALHYLNVFLIRLTSFPTLILIGIYERYFAAGQRFAETGREAAQTLFNSLPRHIKHMPLMEALVESSSNDVYEAIFEVDVTSEIDPFEDSDEEGPFLRSLHSRENVGGGRLAPSAGGAATPSPRASPRSKNLNLALPPMEPSQSAEPLRSAEQPASVNRSPLALFFSSRMPSADGHAATVRAEAAVKRVEAMMKDMRDLPVQKLRDEMKDLQGRQARIQNLLLVLTRFSHLSNAHILWKVRHEESSTSSS
ncbi:putative receptor-activated Ca2 -permeable cation channel [Lyophyllum shimeji]|uniref:Receptor-activated Ca2 -permeable cation channel n=1 Tax=Lyophyllum shimeji TaxID=47721 RepID=A0A9P3Q0D0_LYOSH|nr:putative receptor-activated Ca2 -permeable cation channel [Lyophyllum shimeji]